jgi:hypothetical protein
LCLWRDRSDDHHVVVRGHGRRRGAPGAPRWPGPGRSRVLVRRARRRASAAVRGTVTVTGPSDDPSPRSESGVSLTGLDRPRIMSPGRPRRPRAVDSEVREKKTRTKHDTQIRALPKPNLLGPALSGEAGLVGGRLPETKLVGRGPFRKLLGPPEIRRRPFVEDAATTLGGEALGGADSS